MIILHTGSWFARGGWHNAAGTVSHLADPGRLMESKHLGFLSTRLSAARPEGQSVCARLIQSKSDEARNRIHLKNVSTQFINSLYRTLGITLHAARVDYVYVCGDIYFLSNIESNNSKCCPALPEAWVPRMPALSRSPCKCEHKALLIKRF